MKVAVCLLTYRRTELLKATLASLRSQTCLMNPKYEVSVLVVDNDVERSAQEHIGKSLVEGVPLHYLSNPKNGLATGRNLALEHSSGADFVVFIDDDETASPAWLYALLQTAEENSADVVTGPVYPDFMDAPAWIKHGNFFAPALRKSGDQMDYVATNNTLLRSNVVAKFRFDAKFDFTGGEDTDFFLRVRDAGHSMVWCNEAEVRESIPSSRANASWIIGRAKSDANRFTHGYLGLRAGRRHRLVRWGKSFAGFATGSMRLPLSVLGMHHYVRAQSQLARAAGTAAALRGVRRNDYAGESAQPSETNPLPVVVVGQTPPPLNGQTIMIRDFVAGNYEDVAITFVPMRFSRETKEVGAFDVRKVYVAFLTVVEILRARYRSGAHILYYPPAGANLVPVLRDLILLLLCRPFFRKTVFHFHAAGLWKIYAKLPAPLRPLFRLAYRRPDLAIFTTEATSFDAKFLGARHVAVVPCGVPDPEETPMCVTSSRDSASTPVVLFAGILCEGKGVLTLLHACAALKTAGTPFRLRLMGAFQSAAFQQETLQAVRELDLQDDVAFCGVLSGREKEQEFRDAAIFCFPSHYPAESFGVVLIEAMSFSLPIIATDWQGIPEVTGRDGAGAMLVSVQSPEELAAAMDALLKSKQMRLSMGSHNRRRYLNHFTLSHYRRGLVHSLCTLEADRVAQAPADSVPASM